MNLSLKQFFEILFSIITALFFLISPFIFFIQSEYYLARFDLQNGFEDINKVEVENNFNNIFDFLNSQSPINQNFFSSEDVIHLEDVKFIVGLLYFFVLISSSLIILNSFLIKFKLKYSLYIHIGLLIILGILILNFSESFVYFHEILFNNDYWMLDPTTSNLIKYFPEYIFREVTIVSSIFGIIIHSLIVLSWTKHQNKS